MASDGFNSWVQQTGSAAVFFFFLFKFLCYDPLGVLGFVPTGFFLAWLLAKIRIGSQTGHTIVLSFVNNMLQFSLLFFFLVFVSISNINKTNSPF